MTVAGGHVEKAHAADSGDDANSLQLQLQRPATEAVATLDDNSVSVSITNEANDEKLQVPVVDLTGLADGDAAARGRIIKEVTEACATWGMFQIVNHGVPEKILEELDQQGRNFFALPSEVKERVNHDLGTNYQQQGFLRKLTQEPMNYAWRENLAYCSTWSATEAMIKRVWPNGNAPFIYCFQQYLKMVEALGISLMDILGEGLGLESNFFSQKLHSDFDTKRFYWRANLYPPCADENITVGLSPHADPNVLSLVRQDEICGLQAQKGGRWVDVTPRPGALVVNVGDSLEAWSNGRFTSVVHRAVVNNTQPRLTWVFLLTPPTSMLVQAPAKLIDDEHPRLFKPFTYDDLSTNLYQKVLAARNSQDSRAMVPKRIFYDYALLKA